MKNRILGKMAREDLLWAGIVLVSLSGCKATRIGTVKKDPTYDPQTMRRVFVVAVMQTDRGQKMLEDEFVRRLTSLGREAVASYTLVPHDKKLDLDTWTSLVASNHFDTVIISRLVDMKVVEKDMDAKLIPVGNAGSGYGYYGTPYGSVYQPGSYVREQTATIETKVFDVVSNREVWSAHSKTEIQWGGDPVPQVRTFVNTLFKEARR